MCVCVRERKREGERERSVSGRSAGVMGMKQNSGAMHIQASLKCKQVS